jgi:hypothetical protein
MGFVEHFIIKEKGNAFYSLIPFIRVFYILMCLVEPAMIYILPGYLYYKTCIYFDVMDYFNIRCLGIKIHLKYFGLAVAIFGLIAL